MLASGGGLQGKGVEGAGRGGHKGVVREEEGGNVRGAALWLVPGKRIDRVELFAGESLSIVWSWTANLFEGR